MKGMERGKDSQVWVETVDECAELPHVVHHVIVSLYNPRNLNKKYCFSFKLEVLKN